MAENKKSSEEIQENHPDTDDSNSQENVQNIYKADNEELDSNGSDEELCISKVEPEQNEIIEEQNEQPTIDTAHADQLVSVISPGITGMMATRGPRQIELFDESGPSLSMVPPPLKRPVTRSTDPSRKKQKLIDTPRPEKMNVRTSTAATKSSVSATPKGRTRRSRVSKTPVKRRARSRSVTKKSSQSSRSSRSSSVKKTRKSSKSAGSRSSSAKKVK